MSQPKQTPRPSSECHTRVGVVIPFFQRQPGLLLKAVESIATQSVVACGACSLQVAIVDDASPIPAAQDLNGFQPPAGVRIDVHRQPNGGAGAARNAALDMLDTTCEIVAFLDSDDAWTPNHLERALISFAAGARFFFGDAKRTTESDSLNADLPWWFRRDLRPIDGTPDLFGYTGPADLAVARGLVPTPTVVHYRATDRALRFPSRYFRFGEDQYYLMQVLHGEDKIAYSSAVETSCGCGVNIFANSGRDPETRRLCLLDEIAFRKDALATLRLSPAAREHVEGKLGNARQNLLQHALWQAKEDSGRSLTRSLMAQPSLLLQVPAAVAAVLRQRRRPTATPD